MSEVKLQWCAALAKLTAPMEPEQAGEAFVAMLPMLSADDAAYNRTTLEAAARRDVGDPAVPNFDKISKVLGAWWKDNLPIRVRMGGSPTTDLPALPEPPPKTPEEIAAIQACVVESMAAWKADRAQRRGEVSVPAPADWNPKAVPAAVPFNRDDNPIVRAARAQQAREQAARDAESGRQRPVAAE